MEIHQPKPIRNWRDFLKEVGIIVLGIADSALDPVRIKNYCTMNEEGYQRYRGDRDLR